jgi:hypothetical protein
MIRFINHEHIDYITLETKGGETYPLIKCHYHYNDDIRFDKFILPNPKYTKSLEPEVEEQLALERKMLYGWYRKTESIFKEINKQNINLEVSNESIHFNVS